MNNRPIDAIDLPAEATYETESKPEYVNEVWRASEFVERIVPKIEQAEELVWLNFMVWGWHENDLQPLVNALKEKREKTPDVPVVVYYSARTFTCQKAIETHNELSKCGVIFRNTDRVYLNPHGGANHRKLFRIDEYAGLGGVNPHKETLDAIDYMIVSNNPEFVYAIGDVIEYESLAVVHPNTKYRVDRVDDNTRLLFENAYADRRSFIIDTAIEQLNQADSHAVLVSQFLPMGRVLKAILNAAARGVKVDIVTNNPDQIDSITYRWPAKIGSKLAKFHHWFYATVMRNPVLRNNIRIYEINTRVHAKILYTYNQAAPSRLLIGSDNFATAGELFLTREAAVDTIDPELIYVLMSLLYTDLRPYANLQVPI